MMSLGGAAVGSNWITSSQAENRSINKVGGHFMLKLEIVTNGRYDSKNACLDSLVLSGPLILSKEN